MNVVYEKIMKCSLIYVCVFVPVEGLSLFFFFSFRGFIGVKKTTKKTLFSFQYMLLHINLQCFKNHAFKNKTFLPPVSVKRLEG